METDIAHSVIENAPTAESSTYALMEVTPLAKKDCHDNPKPVKMKKKKEKKGFHFNVFITIIAVTALLLVLIFLTFFLVHYLSHGAPETQQSAVIESLQSLMSLKSDFQIFAEEHQTNELLNQNRIQGIEQELNNTINLIKHVILRSCNDLPQGSPSGYYHIPTNDTGVIHVYCDTSLRRCSCSTSGGGMRVANLDMTDPAQQCPDGFRLIDRTEPPLRTCGRPDGHRDGCVSTTFPVHGIEYSRVCGRIVGYQFGSPSGFNTGGSSIDSHYMAGISLTHGLPRQHIWSFVNAQNENTTREVCPCIQGSNGSVPLFVGNDYFCDSAVRGRDRTEGIYHPDDPLWDGQGCGSTSTCCEFNNPPWFCKQLPQPTTDDIELRLCENSFFIVDDSPFELIQLYIN